MKKKGNILGEHYLFHFYSLALAKEWFVGDMHPIFALNGSKLSRRIQTSLGNTKLAMTEAFKTKQRGRVKHSVSFELK